MIIIPVVELSKCSIFIPLKNEKTAFFWKFPDVKKMEYGLKMVNTTCNLIAPMFFSTPLKHQKGRGFLTFSTCIDKKY